MLKRPKNLDWFKELYRDADKRMSRGQCQDLCGAIGERMRLRLHRRRAVYGWSGGKDSVVLAHIMQGAGILIPGACVLTHLEYPIVNEFCHRHKPRGVQVVRTDHDVSWLLANRQFLFPTDAAVKARCYALVHQRYLDRFAALVGADVLILGRRRLDGNIIPAEFYPAEGKADRYNPIANTPHEFIWACMRHFNLPEYPLYSIQPEYLVTGTGFWAQDKDWEMVRKTDHRIYDRYAAMFAGVNDAQVVQEDRDPAGRIKRIH